MNSKLGGFILLLLAVGTSARSWSADDQDLLKLDKAQSKSLQSDFLDDNGSGNFSDDEDYNYIDYYGDKEGSGEYDDDDEDEYDDYDEEEERINDGEIPGKAPFDPDVRPSDDRRNGVGGVWRFNKDSQDGNKKYEEGLLYEYYNELYEEDYELRDNEVSEESTKKPKQDGGLEDDLTDEMTTEKVMNTSNLLLMVASGLASFAICTIAFFVCCYKRKTSGLGKRVQAMAPFYISSTFVQNPQKEQGVSVRCVAPPSTSIVKNYHLVPQEAKEFISSSGMENSSHVLRGAGERPSRESDKLLLP